MANPICLSPLKFYDSIKKQERHKNYAYGHISPIVMPFNVIQPFQFVIPNWMTIQSVYLRDINDNRVTGNIIQRLNEAGLARIQIENYSVITYSGIYPILDVKYEGQYYLELVTNISWYTYYSEIFCFTNSTDRYIEIEYWNPEGDFSINGGVITFANNFRFKLLINSELGKPEYSFEEESTSRLGYNYVESQVSKKVYKFNAVLPEYICDAMRLIRLCSNKRITCNGDTYEALSFEMDVDWQEQGDLASVNCEFEVDNIIANFGGFRHTKAGGDFNNDYNNDFKTK